MFSGQSPRLYRVGSSHPPTHTNSRMVEELSHVKLTEIILKRNESIARENIMFENRCLGNKKRRNITHKYTFVINIYKV